MKPRDYIVQIEIYVPQVVTNLKQDRLKQIADKAFSKLIKHKRNARR